MPDDMHMMENYSAWYLVKMPTKEPLMHVPYGAETQTLNHWGGGN